MKLKILFIYVYAFSCGSHYLNLPLYFFEKINTTAIKFIIMGSLVPVIAIYMLYQDENTSNPTKWDIIITIMISMILVWMGFEVSNQTAIPVYLGLIISFFLGLFSLNFVLAIKQRVFGKKGLIDDIFSELKNFFKRKLGNGE